MCDCRFRWRWAEHTHTVHVSQELHLHPVQPTQSLWILPHGGINEVRQSWVQQFSSRCRSVFSWLLILQRSTNNLHPVMIRSKTSQKKHPDLQNLVCVDKSLMVKVGHSRLNHIRVLFVICLLHWISFSQFHCAWKGQGWVFASLVIVRCMLYVASEASSSLARRMQAVENMAVTGWAITMQTGMIWHFLYRVSQP